ncbi:treslin isoform X2 [Hyperolius riggenbachi]|uniref:treslin isoform X2 n=1 Tax=Hyperolius riggenbachi TaxID=752182 RepID=UPI0035A3C0C8
MTSSYNVVLLVDAADLALKERIKLLSLRLLNFLTCRVGLGHVRWSYRFLNSAGGRCRLARRSDLRELRPRGWDEYEEELEACWERGLSRRASNPGSCRAALTHTALLETLADFQWDRPDITSPTKPAVRRGRRGALIAVDEPQKSLAGSKNAVFLLSPCPHSRAQLRDFTAGDDMTVQQVMDKLLPRGLQNLLHSKSVTLYWVDTSLWSQVLGSIDYFGYWTLSELLSLVGGRVLPSESLLESSFQQATNSHLPDTLLNIPCDSVLGSLIGNEWEMKVQFPQQDAMLYFSPSGEIDLWESAVLLDPISVNQNYLKKLMKIHVKGILQNWKEVSILMFDTWLLQANNTQASCPRVQQLLHTAKSKNLLLVADVLTDGLPERTGILTPISGTAAALHVIRCTESVEQYNVCLNESGKDSSEQTSPDLQDIVNRVVSLVCSSDENANPTDVPVPEWIKQELSQSNHWNSSIVERWFLMSGASGASSNLMESFSLISAASSDQDEQSYDPEITHLLSEFYQKSTEESGNVTQGENQKKRQPCTPVRQKMKTMPRSLQMLNAARLYSKAQKTQPDGSSTGPMERSSQAKRRSSEKTEPPTKKQIGFKSEDDLISFLKEDYDKEVSGEGLVLVSCVRNAFSAVKSYLKTASSQQVESDCKDKIRLLLKTSKMIRQLYGQNSNKEAKLRECQIQAMLRLEMCVQCPSMQANEDELEEIVEEITDMLRIISLTEDPSFLAKFLGTLLAEYIGSIPKILSEIYFSLGTQIPDELALLLPSDGDDSHNYEGKTPMYTQPSISRVPSIPQITNEEDQLEELRTRSATKRRTSTLGRHRSIAESSQSLKQIEVSKKQINKERQNINPVIMLERLKLPLPEKPQKDAEATKVRRNLFVQENQSPTRRSGKMPRSQSVSAVDRLKHKRSKTHDGTRDHQKLLTKKVTETPVHKQISNRLLYRQIKGRRSDSLCDVSIVEESPEKDIKELDVRRSPRIKQLALTRRYSSSFYASQPKSRNLERVHSASQLVLAADQKGSAPRNEAKTPKRLLFGEVLGLTSPPKRKARRKLLNEPEPVTQETSKKSEKTPRKTPQDSVSSREELLEKMLRKSPCTPRTPVLSPKRLKTPSKSPLEKKSVAKSLGKYFSPPKAVEKSTFISPERRSERLAKLTPSKSDSPNKWCMLPLNSLAQQVTPQKDRVERPEVEVFKNVQGTPKTLLYATTPAKQRVGAFCSPRKSPRLQSFSAECDMSPSHQLRTPQKCILSAPRTPTPNKFMDRNSSAVFHLTPECTPKKADCSSRKNMATADSLSPHTSSSLTTRYPCQTPQKSLPQTPTPKKCVARKSSVVLQLDAECTPKKLVCSSRQNTAAEDISSPNTSSSFTTRYTLQTPQKTASDTPTPKKCVEWKNPVASPFVTMCTPKKSVCSPGKRANAERSTSPKTSPSFITRYQLRTPQKTASLLLQTPKKNVEWKNSPRKCEIANTSSKTTLPFIASAADMSAIPVCLPALTTPSKSELKDFKAGNNELTSISEDSRCPINVLKTDENMSDRCPSPSAHSSAVFTKSLEFNKVSSTSLKHTSAISPKGDLIVLCERLDVSSFESSGGSESCATTSQEDESIDITEATVVQEATSDLKMKLLIKRKSSDSGSLRSLPSTPKGMGNLLCTSPYGLRNTVDRRQREAAARLGTPQIPAKFSTPKSQKKSPPPPMYEVQLEMKESGLPKLRFKRTDSNSTADMGNGTRIEESPKVSHSRPGEEGTFCETWCNKHVMKLESGCVSPCLRSSHSTPGKSSLQTFICQSYTPKRCTSNTASPTQADAPSPWTPSPKYKDKNGSDINNWPRRKKASAVKTANMLKGDKPQDYTVSLQPTEGGQEQDVNKASPLTDFLFDGVSKLLDHSPVIDWKGKGSIGKMTFKSKKRCFDFLSPTKDSKPSSKRSCALSGGGEDAEDSVVSSSQSLSSDPSSSQKSSCEEEVFSAAVITPPAKVAKASLSASGLFSLTQSPMLFKGKTPSSKRKMQDCETQQSTPEEKRPALQTTNPEDSPFNRATTKRTPSRTYTRKRLIT